MSDTDNPVPLDEHATLVQRWYEAKCLAAKHRAAANQAEDELRAALGEAGGGTVGGQLAVRRRRKDVNRFDYQAFAAEHPDLAEEYSYPEQRDRLTAARAWSIQRSQEDQHGTSR